MVVHFTTAMAGPQVETVYSRCKTKLIIICSENQGKAVIPENCDFAQIIPVFGEWDHQLVDVLTLQNR